MPLGNARKSIKHKLLTVPQEMRALPNWVNWEYYQDGDKTTKRPVQPGKTWGAKSNDSNTWSTFKEAVLSAAHSEHLGVSFALSNSPFVFIDLDWKGWSGETLVPESAQKIIDWFESYTEISPSGEGCHIIIQGDLPSGYKSRVNLDEHVEIEIYGEGRFATITGDIIDHPYIEYKQENLSVFLEFFMKRPEPTPPAPRVVDSSRLDISSHDIISKATDSSSAFRSLYNGEIGSHNNDQSRADAALVQLLIWWCNGNESQIDEIFRSSALYRPKWDTKHHGNGLTYGQMTIQTGLSMWDGEGYTGKRPQADIDAVVERYRYAADMILEQGMEVINLATGHHSVKIAMRTLWFSLCDHLKKGHIGNNPDGYYISFGGISTLSGLLGVARTQDTRNRLNYMAEIGFFRFLKQVSGDQYSPIAAFVPEYPEDLGIMRLLEAQAKMVDLRPARKTPVRTMINTIKVHTDEESKPIVQRAKLPAMRATANLLRREASIEQLQHRSGLRRPTVKRHLEALMSLGLVAQKDSNYILIHDFEAAVKMEREFLPSYRNQAINRLERTIVWATKMIKVSLDPARLKHRQETLRIAQARLEAIRDGEIIADVMGRAA